jgi:hypothetical protein
MGETYPGGGHLLELRTCPSAKPVAPPQHRDRHDGPIVSIGEGAAASAPACHTTKP